MEVRLHDEGPDPAGYYNGVDGWSTSVVWIATETTGNFKLYPSSWVYDVSDVWTTGHKYSAVARAKDKAGNYQTLFDVGNSSNAFIFDNSVPATGVTIPAQKENNAISKVGGTAKDLPDAPKYKAGMTSGNGSVKLTLYNKTTDKYWTGSAWTGTSPSTFTADTADNWANWNMR